MGGEHGGMRCLAVRLPYTRRIAAVAVGALIAVSGCGPAAERAGTNAGPLAALDAGDLDQAFAVGGRARVDFFAHYDIANAVAVTPAGAVLTAGTAWQDDLTVRADFALARYRADGQLDRAFGGAGKVSIDLGGTDEAAAVLPRPDGGALVVGTTTGADARSAIAVAAIDAGGALDRRFGAAGVSVVPPSAFGGDPDCAGAAGAALTRDGRVVVVGSIGCGGESGGSQHAAAVRLRADGRLDPTFARGGTWTSASICSAAGVAVAVDGGLIIGATRGDPIYCLGSMTVLKLRRDGAADRHFGRDGRANLRRRETTYAWTAALAIDGRGRILVAGTAGHRIALARLHRNGTRDRAFGQAGWVIDRPKRGRELYSTGVLAGPGGSETVTGADSAAAIGSERFVVRRYRPDGRPETSFGDHGTRAVMFGRRSGPAQALALDAHGRTVAVGTTHYEHRDGDFALVRLR